MRLKLAFVALFVLSSSVYAHSHLANPLPTRRLDCRVGNGRPRDCPGPCPPLDTYGEPTGVGPSRPAEVWRRGERRTITWHRNNHGHGESGFVRFTLVPVEKMMDKSAHEKFTFQVSCWSSGLHRCRSRNVHVCGNDGEGKAYQVPITVPTTFPDNIYVFGWAWIGGGDYKGESFFGDYYSCSFIRIQGGAAVTSSSRPVFIPGLGEKYSDGCLAATNRVGQCNREPCHIGKVRKMSPSGLPSEIYRRDIDNRETQPDQYRPSPERPNRPNRNNNRPGSPFKIEGLQIVDVHTKRMRAVRRKWFRVKTSNYRNGFTLALRVSGKVEKVRFDWQGRSQEEFLPPFVVNGDTDGQYAPLQCRKRHTIQIRCTVYGPGKEETVMYRVKCA